MLTIGLYLHFPFCLSKCAYCDFASAPIETLGGLDGARRHLDALAVETDLRAASPEFHGAGVDTIYLGGGTPTVLPVEWLGEVLRRLRNRFEISADAEVTVEANPGTIDEQKVAALLAAGVNRLSLGVQSFSQPMLAILGRCHSAAEARAAIAAARQAGCHNLSVDLIYGIPTQTLEDWERTIREAIAARPQHISAYGLSLEADTPLLDAVRSGALPEPDEDAYGDMYDTAANLLAAAGYEHYEIANFALPGFECRHNRKYWAGGEYLGLGASAHSYRSGVRWNNSRDAVVYADRLERGLLPVARAERLSTRERVGEMLMLGLRRAEGVAEAEVAERCGSGAREVFADQIQELLDRGMLVAEQGRLRMPQDKWLVSNEVLSYFVA